MSHSTIGWVHAAIASYRQSFHVRPNNHHNQIRHQKSVPLRFLKPFEGTEEAEVCQSRTPGPSEYSSPSPGSAQWCRHGLSQRQSLQSQVGTFPHIWRQWTWQSHQLAGAAFLGQDDPASKRQPLNTKHSTTNLWKSSSHFGWSHHTWRKRSMTATVMYIVSCNSRNLIWTWTSQSMRMARMFPVTSFPSRYLGLTAWSALSTKAIKAGI